MPLPEPLIIADAKRQGGVPCFAGTRVPVQNLFDYLEGGQALEVFLEEFPDVTREHAVAVIELAKRLALAQFAPQAAE